MSDPQKQRQPTGNRRISISVRLPLLFLASIFAIIAAVVVLVYHRFEQRMIDEYTAMGESATMLMSREFDPDQIPMYIEENFRNDEYRRIRSDLVVLKDNYPDVMYMYIYHFIPAGGEVIFDLDSEYSLDADPPGTIYEPDPEVARYMKELCAGEEIPVLTGDTTDGYMLTYMRPVFNSKGEYCCHVCVDFSMETLHREDIRFVLQMLLVLISIMSLTALIDISIMRRTVTGPLNQMKLATDQFSYRNESDHQKNIDIMEHLNIHTGDEIEDIYRLFLTFMRNNLSYMQNLHKAETDIKNKEAQIGQISQAAYRDTLTGVGSKAAYIKKVTELNMALLEGECTFAIVMVDMNNLKRINDEFGHRAGDTYIKGSCHLICEIFKHSPVFRIGGDEFVVILQGHDYEDRVALTESLKAAFDESFRQEFQEPWERFSAAVGMAEHASDDSTFELVFKRADQLMYQAKKEFKAKFGSYR